MPVHNLLTTLQNGARARIRSIPLPYSKAALGITSILLQHGFIHNVTRGTLRGPSPSQFLESGPAARRLWVDLKYGNDDYPVIGHALPVSKPSKKIYLDPRELLRLVTGRRAQFVSPLQLGEIAVVRCDTPVLTEGRGEASTSSIVSQIAPLLSTSQTSGRDAKGADHGKHSARGPKRGAQNSTSSGRNPLSPSSPPQSAPQAHFPKVAEEYLEAREAVGRGLGGEVIARIG